MKNFSPIENVNSMNELGKVTTFLDPSARIHIQSTAYISRNRLQIGRRIQILLNTKFNQLLVCNAGSDIKPPSIPQESKSPIQENKVRAGLGVFNDQPIVPLVQEQQIRAFTDHSVFKAPASGACIDGSEFRFVSRDYQFIGVPSDFERTVFFEKIELLSRHEEAQQHGE